MPLLARGGLAGMLVLGPAPRRRRPVSDAEARLVSLIAARSALAVENHAYQKELIASERLAALGTMAGMLVHDLRGPMTLIRGWAETLLEGDVPPAEAAERARFIVEAVDRLERMTTETLDFARGAQRLVLRSVPLGVLLADLAAGIEAELPGLAVERDFDIDGGRRGTLDVDKIRRAVSNVAANARDAMGGRGRLRLCARVEDARGGGRADRAPRARPGRRGAGRRPRDPRARVRAVRDPRQEAWHRPRPRRGPPFRRGPRRQPRAAPLPGAHGPRRTLPPRVAARRRQARRLRGRIHSCAPRPRPCSAPSPSSRPAAGATTRQRSWR